jgi:hypothetical protein
MVVNTGSDHHSFEPWLERFCVVVLMDFGKYFKKAILYALLGCFL